MVTPTPTLFVLAGPNGAGKSTLYDLVLKGRLALPFINADNIQRAELKTEEPGAAYKAANIAAARRDELLRSRASFVMETVFSHPSKLEFVVRAQAAGYRTSVHHIGLRTADLAVDRVALRSQRGGHAVPEHKIRERYARNGILIRQAVVRADRGVVWDNSELGSPPQQVLRFREGLETFRTNDVPAWVAEVYDTG